MKISKKKILPVAIAGILLILVVIYLAGYNNITQSTEDNTTPTNQENPEGSITGDSTSPVAEDNQGASTTGDTTSPVAQDNQGGSTTGDTTSPTTQDNHEGQFFAVPESPIGTLGLICASAAAFVAYTAIKKKQRPP